MHWWVRGLSCKPNIYVSWSTSELRVRMAPFNRFKSSSKSIFYWLFQGSASFVDHFCWLCFMLVLFFVALWSPAGKGLTSWLLCVFCLVTFPNVSWSTSESRVRLALWNWFKPSSKIIYWPFQGCTSFVELLCFFCLVFAMSLCASVYMCFVVTCWERALICGV